MSKLTPAIAALAGAYIGRAVAASAAVPDFGLVVAAIAAVLTVVASSRVGPSVAAQIRALAVIIVISALLALAAAGATRFILERPGRQAQKLAAQWEVFVEDDFRERRRLEQEPGTFGKGFGEARNGTLFLHGESETSHAVPWTVYESVPEGHDFYAEVRATLEQGPDDVACGLMFAFQDADSWWGMRLVDSSGFLLSRFEGVSNDRLDARTFYGIVELPYANVRNGAKFSVMRMSGVYRFFVNDRFVTELSSTELLNPSGSVVPYAIDTATLHKASYRCSFRDLRVRVAP